MGIIEPANANRANRVVQLAADIGRFQLQVKETTQDILKDDKDTLAMLDRIAKESGHSTLEEYIDAAMKQLPEEDSKAYERVKDELDKQDSDIDIARKVGGGLMALGFGCGVALVSVRLLFKINTISLASQLVARGLVLLLKGSVAAGTRLIRIGSKAVSDVVSGLGDVGKGIAKGLRVLKIAGTVLSVVSIALEGVLLLFELFDGIRQREELQKAIVELCSRRFMVKKIQDSVRVTAAYRSKANSIVTTERTLREVGLSDEDIKKAIKKQIEKHAETLNTELEEVTDDKIWDELNELDKYSGSAWKDDDPNLARVLKWIDDHPDDDEK